MRKKSSGGQHTARINQGKTNLVKSLEELNQIVREYWLPCLHDGGHAIVISAIDPLPDSDDESPLAFSALTRMSNKNRLRSAGSLLRSWGNRAISQYASLADEPLPEPSIPEPLATNDGDSLLFRFPPGTFGSSDEEVATEVLPGLRWRLSDQLLVLGSYELLFVDQNI